MEGNPDPIPGFSSHSVDPGSPIALFGLAQFMHDSDFSDDEIILSLREKIRAIEAKFLPMLPQEVVEGKIWPLIVDSDDVLMNYKTCTTIRCVCVWDGAISWRGSHNG
ncbi:hypothetical protein KC19_VG201500 [Ceratodon purpureus]|uniref:Uncharacterized protein n=1 Tax=Ceratodon purpureus TaxID=3225 RepID=A0A8T0HSH8_CERPU|nr:hypothetical protein KC19_VG201500 [Ceratodon purpureus]